MKYITTISLALAATVVAVPTKNNAIIITSGSSAAILGVAAGQVGNANAGSANANAGAAAGAAAANGSAAQAVSAATQQQVAGTIQQWLADIATVNNFVDTAGQMTDAQQISQFAAATLVAAQDEGTSNTALQQAVQLDASGLSAAQDLLNQFNIIGPAINDTVTNPQNLQKNLAAINAARCPPPAGNGAIFEEGAVQQSAATAAGLTAALPALPNACGTLAQAVLAQQQQGGAAAAAANNGTQGANAADNNNNSNQQGGKKSQGAAAKAGGAAGAETGAGAGAAAQKQAKVDKADAQVNAKDDEE